MDIGSLLNPAGESHVLTEASCYVWTSLHYADTLDCLVYFFFPFPSLKPMYNMTKSHSRVRYDLVLFLRTIRSGLLLVYDMI